MTSPTGSGRNVHAMLFGDTQGFSKLTDEQVPAFMARVLGAFTEVLARHDADVLYRNTWGDAVYVVLTDAPAAAACAVELQDAVAAIELEREGLPPDLALRLGGHLGPIFPTYDPVLNRPSYMGSHVSRTARIEPVTPPGTVYVNEPFAAALVLAGVERFACDYVGHMEAATITGACRCTGSDAADGGQRHWPAAGVSASAATGNPADLRNVPSPAAMQPEVTLWAWGIKNVPDVRATAGFVAKCMPGSWKTLPGLAHFLGSHRSRRRSRAPSVPEAACDDRVADTRKSGNS